MKKSLIMALALMTAIMSSAATFDWETSLGDSYDGMTWYVVNGAGVSEMVDLLAVDGDIDGFNSAISALGSNVSTGTFEEGWGGWQEGTFNPAADVSYLLVIDTLAPGATFYYSGELSTTSAQYTPPSGRESVLLFDSVSSATIAAVPEPASVALLALGLAVLGLKRKVA